MITSVPAGIVEAFPPAFTTTPAPSNPGVAGSSGRTGYFPSIWFRAAGLIGAARICTSTSSGAGVGHGRDSTRNTSAGFPCLSYTAAFIVLLIVRAQRLPHASASNLQTGARIALFGLAIHVFLAA